MSGDSDQVFIDAARAALSQKKTYPADVRYAIQCLVRVGGGEAMAPAEEARARYWPGWHTGTGPIPIQKSRIERPEEDTGIKTPTKQVFSIGEKILYRWCNDHNTPFRKGRIVLADGSGGYAFDVTNCEIKKFKPTKPESETGRRAYDFEWAAAQNALIDMISLAKKLLKGNILLSKEAYKEAEEQITKAEEARENNC